MNFTLSPVERLSVAYGAHNGGLQALKLLCAFLVVVIHTAGCHSHWAFGLTRIAVPVFFMITGFFMVDEAGLIRPARVWRMIVKLLWITVAAQLFYMAFYAVDSLINGRAPSDLWSVRAWVYNLIVGDKFGGHLWYLTACFQALVVVWIAARGNWERVLVWFIPVGLGINLFAGAYAPLLGMEATHHVICRGVVSTALPFIMLGVVLRRRPMLPRVSPMMTVMTVVCVALLLVEDNFVKPGGGGDMIVMTIPLSVMVFIVSAGSNVNHVLADAGRDYATGIYVMHLAVMGVVKHFVGLEMHPALAVATFVVTFVLLALWRGIKKAHTA